MIKTLTKLSKIKEKKLNVAVKLFVLQYPLIPMIGSLDKHIEYILREKEWLRNAKANISFQYLL